MHCWFIGIDAFLQPFPREMNVYLDNAATTAVAPEVAEAMIPRHRPENHCEHYACQQ